MSARCVFILWSTHSFCLQVEELYETYCIQWRLCQGAHNMKRAFSLSPSTRASRESLLELSRNHRTSLQVRGHQWTWQWDLLYARVFSSHHHALRTSANVPVCECELFPLVCCMSCAKTSFNYCPHVRLGTKVQKSSNQESYRTLILYPGVDALPNDWSFNAFIV